MPFAVANDILGYWPVALDFCNIWISLDILSATASILNLCVISLDRYLHMKYPFDYEEWMPSNKKYLALIAVVWAASILISFLPITLEWHTLYSDTNTTTQTPSNPANITATLTAYNPPSSNLTSICNGISCNSTMDRGPATDRGHTSHTQGECIMELNATYATTSSAISFYIPCIVMIAIYIKMYNLARYHVRGIQRTQAIGDGSRNKISQNKALFTLGMIMGLFLLSWIPFFTVNLISSYCELCVSKCVFVAFTWLGYFNSTMNPLIYSKFNSDFREAFKRIIFCQKCRTRDPYNLSIQNRSPKRQEKNGVEVKLNDDGGKKSNAHSNGVASESQTLIDKEDLNENIIEMTSSL